MSGAAETNGGTKTRGAAGTGTSAGTNGARETDAAAESAAAGGVSVIHRPARLSGLASVLLAGAAGALVVADVGGSWPLPFAAALALLVAGDGFRGRGSPLASAAVRWGGVAAGVGAIAMGAQGATEAGSLVRLVPGLAGVLLVAAGVVPLRGDGSRGLLRLGTGVVFLSVLVAGLLRAAPYWAVLAGVAATVVSWDLGEHAIGLGEQLGRAADTRAAELTHGVASLLVGIVAVAAGRVAAGVDGVELPLASLVALVVATAFLALALHE